MHEAKFREKEQRISLLERQVKELQQTQKHHSDALSCKKKAKLNPELVPLQQQRAVLKAESVCLKARAPMLSHSNRTKVEPLPWPAADAEACSCQRMNSFMRSTQFLSRNTCGVAVQHQPLPSA